jgi:hypothetical protein
MLDHTILLIAVHLGNNPVPAMSCIVSSPIDGLRRSFSMIVVVVLSRPVDGRP